VIRNDFPVSPRIPMERSLWILILIMRHRTKMRLLVITNIEELTGIFHRYYNAAQYSTRMEKHRASLLNRCCRCRSPVDHDHCSLCIIDNEDNHDRPHGRDYRRRRHDDDDDYDRDRRCRTAMIGPANGGSLNAKIWRSLQRIKGVPYGMNGE
jgi:hypothetical protein